MTDKELLQLAAKAVGYKWREDIAEERDKLGLISLWIVDPMKTAWNPLTNDGDALRLAVKLGIDCWREGDVICCDGARVDFGDSYAATRRAIVRAAAKIGKDMK